MISYQDLEDRIASLERQTRNLGAGQDLVVGSLSILGEQLLFVLADKDSDGDYDPLTAAAWENSTKSGNGTINWNTVFGVPTAAKAVAVQIVMQDDATGTWFTLFAKSTTDKPSIYIGTQVVDGYFGAHGIVAIAADGTSYYNFTAEVSYFILRVVGWYV